MTINKPKSSLLSVLVVVVLAEKLDEWGEGEGVEGLWGGALGREIWPTNINKCMELDTCFKCHFVVPCMQDPC